MYKGNINLDSVSGPELTEVQECLTGLIKCYLDMNTLHIRLGGYGLYTIIAGTSPGLYSNFDNFYNHNAQTRNDISEWRDMIDIELRRRNGRL
jgi:hypothetical protein